MRGPARFFLAAAAVGVAMAACDSRPVAPLPDDDEEPGETPPVAEDAGDAEAG